MNTRAPSRLRSSFRRGGRDAVAWPMGWGAAAWLPGRGAVAWPLVIVASLLLGLQTASAEAVRALAEAVKLGERHRALELLAEGTDVNTPEVDGTTALMWAAYYGDAELVERLITHGADVTPRNNYGVFALSEAAVTGDTAVIRLLLEAGADPEATLPEGQTALMAVARTGNVEAARLLLDAGADVNATEGWGGQTALMWATAQRQPEMVALLIEHGADIDARAAVRQWDRRVTAEPRPKDMDRGGFTALLYAARESCIECARQLLAAGADIDLTDPDRVPPLGLALMNFNFDFAKFLIEEGADVNRWDLYGRSPLYQAVDMNTLYAADRREGGRADVPSKDATGALEIVQRLLEAGANPNIQLKLRPPFRNVPFDRGADPLLINGATPLLRAAMAADLEVMRLLLEHDALVDLPNITGVTPLMAAAGIGGKRHSRGVFRTEEDGLAAVEMLVAAGADVNARTGHDGLLVHDPIVGAGVRQGDGDGRSAMHGAAMWGWNKVILALHEYGATLDVIDVHGITPLDMALGNYPPAFNDAPADPIPETVTLIEELLEQQVAAAAR
jgi:uncharacterized protein